MLTATNHDGARDCDCSTCREMRPKVIPRDPSKISMRYGLKGRTIHLSRSDYAGRGIDGRRWSFCSVEVLHGVGTVTATYDGRAVYGSRAMKLCKRCMHPMSVAIADGLIAFVAWASSCAKESR